MQFTYTAFLWTLVLLSIPIAIHLFYFKRYQKVLFTNVHFLKELVEETAARNKLKNLLILLTRILAISALIFGFAQPFLSGDQKLRKESQAVSVYVDNSWSMNANSEDGLLFQVARRRAKDIIQSYSDNDRFQIITNNLEGRHQRLVAKEDALSLLEEIQCGPAVEPLSKVLGRIRQCFLNSKVDHADIYLLSDFQQSVCDLEKVTRDSLQRIFLVPVQSIQENNLSVDTAYFSAPLLLPGQSNTLVYKVSNYGTSDVEDVRSSYLLNGQEYPVSSLDLVSGKTIYDSIQISFPNQGWQKIIIKIKDYPIQFDDQYYLACKTEDVINILLLYSKTPNAALVKALESIPYFKVNALPQSYINYGKFRENQLIVLCELNEVSTGLASELSKSIREGVNLLVFPAPEIPASNYASLQSALGLPEFRDWDSNKKETWKVELEADVFKDVFINTKTQLKLPTTFGQYTFFGGNPSEKIIQYRDGAPMLSRMKADKGYIFLSASPLDEKYNELSKSAEVFLPLLFKAAMSSTKITNLAYDLTSNPVIPWSIEGASFKEDLYLSLSGPDELIPSLRTVNNMVLIEVFDQIKKPGIYDLMNQSEIIGSIAFNDNRKESNPQVMDPKSLEEKYGSFTRIIKNQSNEDFTSTIQSEKACTPIWWWLLLAAFLFLLLESLFIRIWKTS